MAKAGGKSITWILLSAAKARADNFYQSRGLAERRLTEWLLAGELRWRSDYLEGPKRDRDPGSGDPEFWREPAPTPVPGDLVVVINLRNLVITWDQSRAERNSYSFYRIEVAADDLTKLLPEETSEHEEAAAPPRQCQAETRPAKRLIEAEVGRRVAAGERYDNITRLSESLHDWMKTVTAKPLKPRSIENRLREWGLWPLPPRE